MHPHQRVYVVFRPPDRAHVALELTALGRDTCMQPWLHLGCYQRHSIPGRPDKMHVDVRTRIRHVRLPRSRPATGVAVRAKPNSAGWAFVAARAGGLRMYSPSPRWRARWRRARWRRAPAAGDPRGRRNSTTQFENRPNDSSIRKAPSQARSEVAARRRPKKRRGPSSAPAAEIRCLAARRLLRRHHRRNDGGVRHLHAGNRAARAGGEAPPAGEVHLRCGRAERHVSKRACS